MLDIARLLKKYKKAAKVIEGINDDFTKTIEQYEELMRKAGVEPVAGRVVAISSTLRWGVYGETSPTSFFVYAAGGCGTHSQSIPLVKYAAGRSDKLWLLSLVHDLIQRNVAVLCDKADRVKADQIQYQNLTLEFELEENTSPPQKKQAGVRVTLVPKQD